MNHIRAVILCILFLFTLSCEDAEFTFNKITCKIPKYINIKEGEVYSHLKDFPLDPSSLLYLEITIYSYSTGLESIIISDNEDIKDAAESGRIKGLVKVTDGKNILSADFIDASGNSKEEMILSLIDKIRTKMRK